MFKLFLLCVYRKTHIQSKVYADKTKQTFQSIIFIKIGRLCNIIFVLMSKQPVIQKPNNKLKYSDIYIKKNRFGSCQRSLIYKSFFLKDDSTFGYDRWWAGMMSTYLFFHKWCFMICFVHIVFLKIKLTYNSDHFGKAYDIADESRVSIMGSVHFRLQALDFVQPLYWTHFCT